jgi:ABC-type transport system involved in multi-copper enzyme maturation permease subunit
VTVAALAGAVGRRLNPVAVRELRASFRGNRYLVTQMILVFLSSLGMFFLLMGLIVQSESGWDWELDSTWIGRVALHVCQGVHLAVVLLVVPAFAATSVCSERERQTLDLMLATGLTPRAIIVGKFCSAMMLTGLLFVSLMPLVCLCFLFGGVTVYQLAINYAALGLLASFLVTLGLAVSAGSPGTARAVITTYAATIFVGVGLAAGFSGSMASPMRGALLESWGVLTGQELADLSSFFFRGGGALSAEAVWVGTIVVPLFLWAVGTGFFFIQAVNRLKPAFANRSTSMRVFHLVTIVSLAGALMPLVAWAFDVDPRPHRPGVISAMNLLLLLVSVSCFFATESPFLPLYLKRKAEAAEKRGWHVWIFHPGSRTGVSFVMAANGVALALLGAWYVTLSDGRPLTEEIFGFLTALGSLAVWTWFLCGLGALLSGFVERHPLAPRIAFVSILLLMCLLPVIHAVYGLLSWTRAEPPAEHVSWSAVFSPVMAMLASLESAQPRSYSSFPVTLPGHLPVPVAFVLLMGALGALMNLAAWRRSWSRLKQQRRAQAMEEGRA